MCLCVVVLCHDFNMEQRAAIKFCFRLGKSASETYEFLQKAYGSDSLSCSVTFEWFKRFQEGWESLEDDERSGRPTTSRNEQTIEKVPNSSYKIVTLHCKY
jgi:transposase